MIGKNWLTITDEAGVSRLASGRDFVQQEIREALDLDLDVFPVLIDGAKMPSEHQLPSAIETFGTRQAFDVRDPGFENYVKQLGDAIERRRGERITELRGRSRAAFASRLIESELECLKKIVFLSPNEPGIDKQIAAANRRLAERDQKLAQLQSDGEKRASVGDVGGAVRAWRKAVGLSPERAAEFRHLIEKTEENRKALYATAAPEPRGPEPQSAAGYHFGRRVRAFPELCWANRVRALAFVTFTVLATAIVSARLSPVFESFAEIEVEHQPAVGVAAAHKGQSDTGDDRRLQTEAEIMRASAADILSTDRADTRPLSGLVIAPVSGTWLIKVTCRSHNQKASADLANAFASSWLAARAARKAALCSPGVQPTANGDGDERKNSTPSSQATQDESLSAMCRVGIGQVAVKAAMPGSPVFPNIKANVEISALASSALCLLMLLAELLIDRAVGNPDDIENDFGIEFLGSLPLVKSWRGRLPSDRLDSSPREIFGLSRGIANNYEEAIRAIRNSIRLSSGGDGPRSLLLTSAAPREGKSTTAVHLAVVHSQQKRQTLLIDADLRRPSIYQYLGVSNERGLSNVVNGEMEWRDALQKTEVLPWLTVLPAGPASRRAADNLGPVLKQILAEGAGEYDLVICDAPPVLAFAETIHIATIVDGVVVVARSRQTPQTALASLLQKLFRLNVTVIGFVLNETKSRHHLPDAWARDYRRYYL